MADTHAGLPRFDYIHASTLDEASNFLYQHPDDARPFLGGTDLFVRLRDGHLKLNYLVDLKTLPGMNIFKFNNKDGLTIGGAVTMNQVIASEEIQKYYPLLAESAASVASYQLRNRATLVGNICNASPAGDTIGAALLYLGSLSVYSKGKSRQIPLKEFFLGPGKTLLKPGEIVTEIHFPPSPVKHRAHYLKLGRNALSDLSIIGISILGYPDSSLPSGFRFRIALASVAPVPLITYQAEEILANNKITEKIIEEAAQAAANACQSIDDVRASAEYRNDMVHNLMHQALQSISNELSSIKV
jgi:CO/xanthine dehydrogenase FAD-binding subunit